MAEPIRIIITQGGTGGAGFSGGNITPRGRDTGFGKEDVDAGFTKKEQMALAGVVMAASKKAIMNSINNNLVMTGNYIQTSELTKSIQMTTKMAGLGIATFGIAKAASSGLISAPVAVIAVAGLVINEGMNAIQKMREIEMQINKTNYQAERMRIRAGTSLGDGSRGTNG